MWKSLISGLLMIGLSAHADAAADGPPKTVDHVDLKRYVGRWYEIARLPNRFEKKCDRDVTAEYALDGKSLRVVNSCRKKDGTMTVARGRAKLPDARTQAKLKVTFFWPFYGDYWILGLDSEYQWAVVGDPSRKYLWILSRTPRLSESGLAEVRRVLREAGYVESGLIWTKQAGQ